MESAASIVAGMAIGTAVGILMSFAMAPLIERAICKYEEGCYNNVWGGC